MFRNIFGALAITTSACLLLPSLAWAMEMTVAGDQLILSGPVVARDYDEVAGTLAEKPQIKIVILRNSPGGDAPTGYHLGELFRQKSLQTAVSGYCYSSCSRLYLGGYERYFSDDYPPEYTQIGFHGHYRNGDLNAAYVAELHLRTGSSAIPTAKLTQHWSSAGSTSRAELGSFISTTRRRSISTDIRPLCARAPSPVIRGFSIANASPRPRSNLASRPRRPWSIAATSNRSAKRSCPLRRHPAMRRLRTTQSCPASAKSATSNIAGFLQHPHPAPLRSRLQAAVGLGIRRWSRMPRGGRSPGAPSAPNGNAGSTPLTRSSCGRLRAINHTHSEAWRCRGITSISRPNSRLLQSTVQVRTVP